MEHPKRLHLSARKLPSALAIFSLLLASGVTATAQYSGSLLSADAQRTPDAVAAARRQTGQHQHTQATPSPTPTPTPAPTVDHSGHQMQTPRAGETRADAPQGPALRLEDLEARALRNNPTLAQAEAAVRAAEGRSRQAGLWPNPTVGYQGEDFAFRSPAERSKHSFFVEQTIPLGGKLSKARRVFARERERAEALSEAQRQRVLNSVRLLFYDALGAQRLTELRADLAKLAREAVATTRELYNVGQADRPDLTEIEIEAERAEIELLRADNERERAWAVLAAMVGEPELRPARLADELEDASPALESEQLLATLMRDSPEVRAARASLERARAALERAKAQRAPDLFVRGGVGYANERLDDGRKVGPEGFVEAGVTLPIFNRNQGGIAAAEAEVAIAERELDRLQLVLRTRLASTLREYRNASRVVEKYRAEVIPRARGAYETYLANFRQMAASYPQVLIAQRTLFQVEVEYARALTTQRQSAVALRGFLLTGGLGGAEDLNGEDRSFSDEQQ